MLSPGAVHEPACSIREPQKADPCPGCCSRSRGTGHLHPDPCAHRPREVGGYLCAPCLRTDHECPDKALRDIEVEGVAVVVQLLEATDHCLDAAQRQGESDLFVDRACIVVPRIEGWGKVAENGMGEVIPKGE
jgi:hypothetical protein